MSSISGQGIYHLVENNDNGYLALNVSIIGKEFGVETILINRKTNLFYFKTKLSSDKNNEIYMIQGKCNEL
tara:strand:- start:49 stop:261 length:213 start_codon:yes stop_codon:yes gene_type:complete